MTPLNRFIVALTGAALTAAPMATQQALAQQVGTATAVNPLSESTPPGGTTTPLTVGAHIVHNEHIHTTPQGTAQLRFTDKSSMSIAPNTSIVIDEYVYDPNGKSGHMLVSLTQGALRFVGGQLSHAGETTITTSAATIGIRGATVTIIQGRNGTEVIDHFGYITIQNNAGIFYLTRPDFKMTIANSNTAPTTAIRVTPGETLYYQQYIMSQNGQDGGVKGLHTVTIGHCGLGTVQSVNCPQSTWTPNDIGQLDATQLLSNATHFGTGTPLVPSTPPSQRNGGTAPPGR
jgi:FecR-like protein